MCGIVGLIARTSTGFLHSDLEVMENMLVLDTLRGLDSTGVFAVDRNKQVGIMKIASHPHHLFACEEWKKMRSKTIQSGRIIMGHNRKATQGSINSENAHPFHENNIVLIHNGTLRGDHKKLADTEVDSHAVCHAFNEQGAEQVIPTIDGAFAFVWWDMEKEKLFAIRNDERPLNLILTRDLFVIASEPWMAYATLERQGKKVEEKIELDPGLLYEFSLNGKFTTTEIKLKEEEQASKKHGGTVTLIKEVAAPKSQFNVVRPPFVENNQFPVGKSVMAKIWSFQLSDKKNFYKVIGKVVEPGLPKIDFVYHVPAIDRENELGQELTEMMNGYVVATVASYITSNCGPSVFLRDMKVAPYVSVHNDVLTQPVWQYVMSSCKCKFCQAKIYDEEAPFTVVEELSVGDFRVVCADCVEDKLPIGEIKNEFNARRHNALQITQPVSDQLAECVIDLSQAKGSPTVH